MDKLKYIKLENEDGSYSSSIPLAVDSNYVDVNGSTLTNVLNQKATKAEVQALASGSPAGVYSTFSALTTADPDHSKIYVVIEDGHWYYYNNGWQDGGTYQAVEDSEAMEELKNDVENLAFALEESAIYNGTWWGDSTELHNVEDYKTIKYIIPDYVTEISIDTYFYGMLRVYISNVEDPTTVALNGNNSLKDPSSDYQTMTHHVKTYNFEAGQYKYAYVPYYIPRGKSKAKGHMVNSFESLREDVDNITDTLDNFWDTMANTLSPVVSYHCYWKGDGSAFLEDRDWTTYKFEIPSGVKKLYLKAM